MNNIMYMYEGSSQFLHTLKHFQHIIESSINLFQIGYTSTWTSYIIFLTDHKTHHWFLWFKIWWHTSIYPISSFVKKVYFHPLIVTLSIVLVVCTIQFTSQCIDMRISTPVLEVSIFNLVDLTYPASAVPLHAAPWLGSGNCHGNLLP